MTYAMSATSPPRPEDLLHLRNMRFDFPRATVETMAAFDIDANQALRALARKEGVPLIDVAAELGGRRELFGDLVHFNDAGAKAMAAILAEKIVDNSAPTSSRAMPNHHTYGADDRQER
jgi:hypothetical protein